MAFKEYNPPKIKRPDMSIFKKDTPIFGIPMRNKQIDLAKWLEIDEMFN